MFKNKEKKVKKGNLRYKKKNFQVKFLIIKNRMNLIKLFHFRKNREKNKAKQKRIKIVNYSYFH